mmetsp:Transcript_13464/g.33029  ORF Transcript_13464/g.33029 Transcript_13464/m.33029 type:complete len:473 (+) Transcript_13464:81-1499(+)
MLSPSRKLRALEVPSLEFTAPAWTLSTHKDAATSKPRTPRAETQDSAEGDAQAELPEPQLIAAQETAELPLIAAQETAEEENAPPLANEEERPRRLCELLSEAAGRDGGVEGGEENQNILDAIEARLAELKPLAGAKPSAATLLQGYDELVSAEALPIAAELPPRIATELHATRQRTEALLVTRIVGKYATRCFSLRKERPLLSLRRGARFTKNHSLSSTSVSNHTSRQEQEELGFNTPNLLQLDFVHALTRFRDEMQSLCEDGGASLAAEQPKATKQEPILKSVEAKAQLVEGCVTRFASLYAKLLLLNRSAAYDPSTQSAYSKKIHHDIASLQSVFPDASAVDTLYDLHEFVGCEYVMIPLLCVRYLVKYAGLLVRDVNQILRFHRVRDREFASDLTDLILMVDAKRRGETPSVGTTGSTQSGVVDAHFIQSEAAENGVAEGGGAGSGSGAPGGRSDPFFSWVHEPFWWA